MILGVDVSNACTRLPLAVFKDMIKRAEEFKRRNRRNPKIVYVNRAMDYVSYERFEEMYSRYDKFIREHGREPMTIIINPDCEKKPDDDITTHSGHAVYLWVMNWDGFDPRDYKSLGFENIFLSEKAFLDEKLEDKTRKFIETARRWSFKVHAWIQCLKYNNAWISPSSTLARSNISSKIQRAMKFDVAGIHLDYIRYPGNAYIYKDSAKHITALVKYSREIITGTKLQLSAAVMPERNANAYYYGQDYKSLGEYLDFIVPMAYKGNYKASRDWIKEVVKYVREDSNRLVVAALQSYRSDDDPTPLHGKELHGDMAAAMEAGAYAVALFRHGLISPDFFIEKL